MNDQVYNIQDLTTKAATINSDYTPEQREDVKNRMRNGELSILYLSPEALISISNIKDIVGDRQIGLFVIDEAHIVSTWGKSFRPDYWYLGDYIARLRNKLGYHFPVATFSATITYGGVDDMHVDIINSLHMKTGPYEYIGPVRRNNIGFDIRLHKKENDYRNEKHQVVISSIKDLSFEGCRTLAYFPFVSHLKEVHSDLTTQRVKSECYYGGEDKNLKREAVEKFRSGDINTILCTKAFGMGIDIDDIDTVYHYAPTGNLCDYVQEIGRCARDKDIQGTAITDYFDEDFRYINQLYGMSAITNFQIIAVLKKLRETYYSKKSRNFVISPDDFSYIFAERRDMSRVDSELKTALLMIQKDFERDPMLSFKPIIFKPRSLFTKGYVMIVDEDLHYFKNNKYFRKYFSLYRTKDEMASKGTVYDKKTYIDRDTGEAKHTVSKMQVSVRYHGDIYTVNFKQMWEDEYNDHSFAQFKYQFFNGTLEGFEVAEKLKPEYLLHVQSEKKTFREIVDEMEKILLAIRDSFAKNVREQSYKIGDIARVIKRTYHSRMTDAECEIAAANYINIMNVYESAMSFSSAPVFKHRDSYDDWSLSSYALLDRKTKKLVNEMKSMFGMVMDLRDRTFLVNLARKSGDQSKLILARKEFNVAQLLEIFKLATYDVTSGERPEYFIRINSIRAIERILDQPSYQSEMVQLSKQRHQESVKMMKEFFTQLNTDEERWDYIEKYFVGMDEEDAVD